MITRKTTIALSCLPGILPVKKVDNLRELSYIIGVSKKDRKVKSDGANHRINNIDRTMITQLGDRHYYSGYSDRVGYIYQEFKKPGKNGRTSKIKCLYVGCSSYLEAKKVASQFRGRVFVRESQRVPDWEWEVKMQGDWELCQVDAIASQVTKLLDDGQGSGRNVVSLQVKMGTGLRQYYTKDQWRKRSLIC